MIIEAEAAACHAAFVGVPVGAFVWCFHHHVLCEPLFEPAEVRLVYILHNKPIAERARRLREFRPVRGELPAKLVKIGTKLVKARIGRAKARIELGKISTELPEARAKWEKARALHVPALEVLHRAECPDSAWNGQTILKLT